LVLQRNTTEAEEAEAFCLVCGQNSAVYRGIDCSSEVNSLAVEAKG